MVSNELKNRILVIQQNEITEFEIYRRLGKIVKDEKQVEILNKIAQEELAHYDFWKQFTTSEAPKNYFKINFYFFVAKIFGLTFGLKLMENGENNAQDVYAGLRDLSPEVEKVIADEDRHEHELLNLIDEERLKYASSVVLGLNDALVELTGALVGFTLALQNTKLVGIVGLITGIAASLSMAASEYLSTKQEDAGKNPLKASIYTGIAYTGTVVALILPYLIFKNIYLCLGLVIMVALSIIFIFTYYISVAKGLNFKKRFIEMAGISLGVAIINFIIGLIIRQVFGIEV